MENIKPKHFFGNNPPPRGRLKTDHLQDFDLEIVFVTLLLGDKLVHFKIDRTEELLGSSSNRSDAAAAATATGLKNRRRRKG